jgi:hypothetical protein
MTTTTLNKTAAQVLLAHTQLATATQAVGSAVDVSTKVGAATAFVKMGRTVATALGAQLAFRLEGSAKTSGNDEWVPIYEWTSANGTTAASASTVNDASFNAGDTSFTITSATGITGGDAMYLRETGTPANSEWARIGSVSGTTITLEEPCTRAHTNGITTTDLAEMWALPFDITGQVRVRLVVNSNNVTATGQTVDVLAYLVTADSAATA